MPNQSTNDPDSFLKGMLNRAKSMTFRGRNEREDMINTLRRIYEGIRDSQGNFYDPDVLLDFRIKYCPLDLDKQPTPTPDMFFIPMAQEELDKHKVDLTDALSKAIFESRGAIWDQSDVPEFLRKPGRKDRTDVMSRFHNGKKVYAQIRENFLFVKRGVAGMGSPVELRKLTKWRYGAFKNSLLDDEFFPDVLAIYNTPDDCYEAHYGLPHVMVSLAMCHPHEKDCLEQPELLTILGITISQLNRDKFKEQNVIPIKVLSFCGTQGRILEAYYSHRLRQLIVKASPLYSFSTEEESVPNVDLFVRHMACKLEGQTWNLHLESNLPS